MVTGDFGSCGGTLTLAGMALKLLTASNRSTMQEGFQSMSSAFEPGVLSVKELWFELSLRDTHTHSNVRLNTKAGIHHLMVIVAYAQRLKR